MAEAECDHMWRIYLNLPNCQSLVECTKCGTFELQTNLGLRAARNDESALEIHPCFRKDMPYA